MKNQLISSRLNINAGIMSWYVKELKQLAQAMTKECKEKLAEIYRQGYPQIAFDERTAAESGAACDEQDAQTRYTRGARSISSQARIALNQLYKKYSDKFSKRSKTLCKQLLKRTNRYSNNQLNNALKAMLGSAAKDFLLKGSAISPEKSEIMKALLFENVSLIKSIPNEYFKQITGAVARSIENGEGIKQLAKELRTYGAKTERRAGLIAQDQTRKAYNTINLRNFQENGIRQFKWLHSGGSRDPRDYHKTDYPNGLNGGIFDIDAPPVIDKKTGEKGFPGQLPYCRCVMQAVLNFDD